MSDPENPCLQNANNMDYVSYLLSIEDRWPENYPSESAIVAINEAKSIWADKFLILGLYSFLLTLNETPSLSNQRNHQDTFRAEADPSVRIILFQTLGSLLNEVQTASSEEDIFHCLLLVERIYLATFCQLVTGIKDQVYDILSEEPNLEIWYRLRLSLDNFQGDLRAFSRYVRQEFDNCIFQEQIERLREDQEDLLAEAQSLETFLRDSLQASVGIKSLEESRTSIEEGKGVKLSETKTFGLLE
ncbi:MAG: hypothetical protein Q9167_005915 [Letrouitia subvulpina]